MPAKGDAVECLDGWTDADGAHHAGHFGDAATPEVIAAEIEGWASTGELVEAADDQREENPFRRTPVAKFTIGQLIAEHPTLKPAVIDGVVREAETVNVVSTSKVGKSWLVYGLALCIATGRNWLDTYGTSQGRVLLIDNELHRSTLASRIPTVAAAMEISQRDYADDLEVWPLRGDLRSFEDLGHEFEQIEPGTFKAIILDAKYRFLPVGTSENDNAAETQFYNSVDYHADRLRSPFVMVHHSSKGDQSGKRVTDVGRVPFWDRRADRDSGLGPCVTNCRGSVRRSRHSRRR